MFFSEKEVSAGIECGNGTCWGGADMMEGHRCKWQRSDRGVRLRWCAEDGLQLQMQMRKGVGDEREELGRQGARRVWMIVI